MATRWHPYVLLNLDFPNVPRAPRAAKRENADAYINPDVPGAEEDEGWEDFDEEDEECEDEGCGCHHHHHHNHEN